MASDDRNAFQYRTFCIVTGASKGLGRTISVEFAAHFPKSSVLMLMARSEDKLREVKAEISAQYPGVHVVACPINLSQTEGSETRFRNIIENTLKSPDVQNIDFQQALIVHNAGSLGDISKNMIDFCDSSHLTSYWGLNLTSVVTLNSVFFDVFKKYDGLSQKMAINISSICALQPFQSWALYCAGKAARDMLFRAMAQEEKAIRVLNYAPGPIDTDMQLEARTLTGNDEIKKMFVDIHRDRKLLSCESSVSKLLSLLKKNTFDSGYVNHVKNDIYSVAHMIGNTQYKVGENNNLNIDD